MVKNMINNYINKHKNALVFNSLYALTFVYMLL